MKNGMLFKQLLSFCCLLVLAAQAQSQDCSITSPVPGSTLGPSSTVFTWTGGTGAYFLSVSAESIGGNEIFDSGILPREPPLQQYRECHLTN